MRYTYRYRSFFWPALLILAGVVALLVNIGQIPVERLAQIIDLWPLILVVIGLELIVRRTVHGVAGDVAAALIVLLAIGGAAAYVAVGPAPSATHTLDASDEVGGLTEATAEIDAGAATITVNGTTDIGAELFRVHIDYGGQKPEVRLDRAARRLVISQRNSFPFFQSRKFELRLDLNPAVAWQMDLNTGSASTSINAARLHVTSLKLNTGASKDEITLGQPSGHVPVQINGGALTVSLHTQSGVEGSVRISGGAVTLNAFGQTQRGVGSLTYQSKGLGAGTDSYEIEVNGGACTVTWDTTTESP